MNGSSSNGGSASSLAVGRTNSLPGMARTNAAIGGKATLTRAASTEELGTAAQVGFEYCNGAAERLNYLASRQRKQMLPPRMRCCSQWLVAVQSRPQPQPLAEDGISPVHLDYCFEE